MQCESSYEETMAPLQSQIAQIQASKEWRSEPSATEQFLKLIFCPYFYDRAKLEQVNFRLSLKAFRDGNHVDHFLRKNVTNTYNIHAQLRQFAVPTLIIHGDSDPIFLSTAQKIHESIPSTL